MGSDGRFIYSFFLLALLTLKVQSQEDIPLCRDNEGFCIREDKEPCHHISNSLRCEQENYVCCLDKTASDKTPIPRQEVTQCWKLDPPDYCLEEYGGTCQLNCKDDRIHFGFCADGNCKCCGCPMKDKCRENGGYCTLASDTCEGRLNSNWCEGARCYCCMPDCPKNENCTALDGKCKTSCHRDEEHRPDITCLRGDSADSACMCCVPRKDCESTEQCKSAGGYCNATCPSWKYQNFSLCEGDCTCCLDHPCDCKQTETCASADGRCDLECKIDEKVDTSVPCLGKNCICCVPDCGCKESRECAEGKGRCAKRCNESEMADRSFHCEGDHCACCVPRSHCTCSQECSFMGGRCDDCCDMNEFLNSSLSCYGENCHCCLLIAPCEKSIECDKARGRCARYCDDNEISDRSIHCEGEHCVCCRPMHGCSTNDECRRKGLEERNVEGRCDERCYSYEYPIYSVTCPDSETCNCCVPDKSLKDPCSDTSECSAQGGVCDKECYDNEGIADVECGGSDCICCVRQSRDMVDITRADTCPITLACAARRGNCKPRCNIDELPDTRILCNDGHCVCCIPKGPCKTSDECLEKNGHCAKCCPSDYLSTTIPCEGEGCTCCVPECHCNTTANCSIANGRCDHTCMANEIKSHIPCMDSNCHCCVPVGCGTTTECEEADGRCDTCCEDNEIRNLSLACLGNDCECCVSKCKTTPSCHSLTGRCDKRCRHGENQHKEAECGPDCVCCVQERDVLCKGTECCHAAGGYCDSKCQVGFYRNESLCYQEKCGCCIPNDIYCPPTTLCQRANGRCDLKCRPGERVDLRIPCVEGRDCVCCVPDYSYTCRNSSCCTDIGGHCASFCDRGDLRDPMLCSGEHCTCCITLESSTTSSTSSTTTSTTSSTSSTTSSTTTSTTSSTTSSTKSSTTLSSTTTATGCVNTTCFQGDGRCVKNNCTRYQWYGGVCDDGCTCCVDIPCEYYAGCSGSDGICAMSCKQHELEISNDPDCGHVCKCCVDCSRNGNSVYCQKECNTTNSCLREGGRCDTLCVVGEYSHPTAQCEDGCMCCVEKTTTRTVTATIGTVTATIPIRCGSTQSCLNFKGECKTTCSESEYISANGKCITGCTCCLTEMTDCVFIDGKILCRKFMKP